MSRETSEPLRRLSAFVQLGFADWRDVERYGLQRLEEGESSPEMVSLADVTRGTDSLGELISSALTAAGGTPPSIQEVVRIGAIEVAHRILDTKVGAYEGARTIWRIALIAPEIGAELRPFIGLASEWEDHLEYRALYEADIMEWARSFLDSTES